MTDTIAAISTGGGISAIGIIRVSGADAIKAADAVFRSSSGISLTCAENRRLYYGKLMSVSGEIIDLCLVTVSRGPNSYTGEDTAEFHCHGSPVILSEGLRALFSQGARQAEAGEFTKRAFLNGRMDLTQAEAVIDLIEAETLAAAKNAAGQLRGAVRDALEAVYTDLLDIMAHFHAVIDYPDEDIDDFAARDYLGVLSRVRTELERLHSTYERGSVLKAGVPAAIIGRPNTGKSSLLNALLGYDRAIVTDIAGTTRDTLEEKLRIGNVLLRVIDTAGIRKTDDAVEKLGVRRSLAALREARLAILVFDGSEPLRDEDLEVLRAVPEGMPGIAVINKSDLPNEIKASEFEKLGFTACRVSAATGEGLDAFENEIKELYTELSEPPRGELITNARQADAILQARDSVREAAEALEASVTPDAVLTEVEAALSAIGEITGRTLREDVTARIFERFCVGK